MSNVRKRLTDEDKIKIVEKYRNGESRKSIANEFEIDPTSIDKCINGANANIDFPCVKWETIDDAERERLSKKWISAEMTLNQIIHGWSTSYGTVKAWVLKHGLADEKTIEFLCKRGKFANSNAIEGEQQNIETAKGMTSEMVPMLITPEIAQRMLDKNPINRRKKVSAQKRYAIDVNNSKWYDNGQGNVIAIDKNGILRDGQNRLEMVILTGKSLWFWVCYVDPEQAQMYDMGVKRSMGDTMKFCNDERVARLSDNRIGSIAAFHFKHKYGKTVYTQQTCIAEIQKDLDVYEWISETRLYKAKKAKGLSKVAILACLTSAYKSGYPEDKLQHFSEVMVNGIMDSSSDAPIIKFREWVMNTTSEIDINKGRVGGEETYMRCQYALHCLEVGNKRGKCQIAKEEYYKFYGD